ncbi:MAG: metal-dependent hydrolase [Planctomycetota bacterium]
MDGLCHLASGGLLAATGLRRAAPRALPALVLGACAPDIEAVWTGGGQARFFDLHRGWTHSLFGLPVLSLALAAGLVLWDRRASKRPQGARFRPLFLLSLLATGLHLFLDFCNTYGVRPLLPFDGRWFYGDALFIVDPWMWGLPLLAIHLFRPRPRALTALLWALWTAMAALFFWRPEVAAATLGCWLVLPAIALLRDAGLLGIASPERMARALSMLLALYVTGMFWVQAKLARDFRAGLPEGARASAVLPSPAHPLRWTALAVLGGELHVGALHYGLPVPRRLPHVLALNLEEPRVRRFAATAEGRIVMDFFRFPFARRETIDGRPRLVVRDARFGLERRSSVGVVVLE